MVEVLGVKGNRWGEGFFWSSYTSLSAGLLTWCQHHNGEDQNVGFKIQNLCACSNMAHGFIAKSPCSDAMICKQDLWAKS